jgi:uncharacterized membrane protein
MPQEKSMNGESARTDQRTDELMGLLLRSGVILAACIVLVGGMIYLARHPRPSDYRVFQGEPETLRTIPGILSEAMEFHARGLIQLGLLVLIATPIARVIFSVLAFCSQRDWKYVFFTLIVLGLLLYSLLGRR